MHVGGNRQRKYPGNNWPRPTQPMAPEQHPGGPTSFFRCWIVGAVLAEGGKAAFEDAQSSDWLPTGTKEFQRFSISYSHIRTPQLHASHVWCFFPHSCRKKKKKKQPRLPKSIKLGITRYERGSRLRSTSYLASDLSLRSRFLCWNARNSLHLTKLASGCAE